MGNSKFFQIALGAGVTLFVFSMLLTAIVKAIDLITLLELMTCSFG